MEARDEDNTAASESRISAALIVLCYLGVIFLSTISLDLAVFSGFLVTIIAFYIYGIRRIAQLEHFLQLKFHNSEQRAAKLERDLARVYEELRRMEREISHAAVEVKAPSGAYGARYGQKPEYRRTKIQDIIPAFLRPQTWAQTPHDEAEKDEDEESEEEISIERIEIIPEDAKIAHDEFELDDPTLSDMVIRELIHHAVESSRIDVFIQPIVRLPQRQIKFFEMFARIRAKAGVYLPATRYMNLAREENVMASIDNILLLHGLQALRRNKELQRQSSFFLNIKPQTLRDGNFMSDLLDFLSKNRDLASSLIFELRQDDFITLTRGEEKILRGLAEIGCALSLDNIEEIPNDIAALQDQKIRFIKINADKLLDAAKTDRSFNEMVRMKRKLESNGIGVIVEKIESEAALLELLDFNIHYGQGFLFGRPDLQGVYAKKRKVS